MGFLLDNEKTLLAAVNGHLNSGKVGQIRPEMALRLYEEYTVIGRELLSSRKEYLQPTRRGIQLVPFSKGSFIHIGDFFAVLIRLQTNQFIVAPGLFGCTGVAVKTNQSDVIGLAHFYNQQPYERIKEFIDKINTVATPKKIVVTSPQRQVIDQLKGGTPRLTLKAVYQHQTEAALVTSNTEGMFLLNAHAGTHKHEYRRQGQWRW